MKKTYFTLLFLLVFSLLNAQNNCLDFDGTDDYVDVGTGPGTVKTVEFWVNPASTTEYLIDLNGTAYIWINSGTVTASGFDSPTIYVNGVSATSISANIWQHITVTTNTGINADNFDIGRNGSNYLTGKIEEVRIWNNVRIEAEIRANMYKELDGTELGLVSYYKLNETTGPIADNAEGTATYDGTWNGSGGGSHTSPAWQTSPAFAGPKNCLDFDGSDDYVDCGNNASLQITGALTLEAWIYLTAGQTWDGIISKSYWDQVAGGYTNTSYTFKFHDNTETFEFWITSDGTEAARKITYSVTPLSTGQWYHIAAVYSPSTYCRIYINGLIDGEETSSIPASIYNSTRPVCIGCDQDSDPASYAFFTGKIDEVRIWNVARTDEQIRDNMCRTLNGDENGLVAYYRFDQKNASGQTTLYDITSNENHGTLTSMEATADWVDCTAFDTWIGWFSSSWSEAKNWSRGLPSSTDNVGIHFWTLGHHPTISSSSSVKTIVIGLLANLTLSSGLQINGSLFELGGLTHNNQTVTFAGSSKQNLVGSLEFYNLTISNTHASNKVSAWWCTSLSVLNNLTITDGIFYSKSDYKNVSIGTNGTLELSGNINVSGNWDNDGDFTHNDHTVIFDGSSTQTIQGDNTTTFHNLTINSGKIVDIDAGGKVTVSNTLSNSGTFTVKSSSSGTGSMIVSGTSTDDIIFKRYVDDITKGDPKWHYVSAPLAGQAIDGDYMTNNSIYSPNGGTNYNFYRWDELTNYWIIYGSTGSPATFGDGTFVEARGYSITRNGAGELSFTGTVRTSNLNYATTHTVDKGDGFNLVGNPFTSSLMATETASATLNFLTVNTARLDDSYEALYIWDEQSGYSGNRNDYKVICNAGYSGFGSSSVLSQHYISPGQAFMVKVASAGDLAFNTNMQAHNNATFYKNNKEIWPSFELIVESDELFNSTAICFNENMTIGLDPSYDVGKLKGNPDIALYTKLIVDNGVDFVIQALPYFEQDYSVKVGLDIANAGEYTFTAVTMEQIPEEVYVYFEDKLTGKVTNLKETNNYTCVISEAGSITNRFVFHFTLNPFNTEEIKTNQSNIQIWSANKTINILNPENLKGQIRIINMYGQKLMETPLNGDDRQQITINIPTGNYVVNIVDQEFTVSKKIFIGN